MPTATPFIRYVTKPFITKLVAAIALLITISYSYFFIDGWLYSDGCVQGNCDNGFGTFTYKKTAYQAVLFSDAKNTSVSSRTTTSSGKALMPLLMAQYYPICGEMAIKLRTHRKEFTTRVC